MYCNGTNLLWPNREQELADYLGSYTQLIEDNPYAGRTFCPLCGQEIQFGQHMTEGPNGYRLHNGCFETALHEAVEADEDVGDPQGEWLADAIAEAIIDRGELYDTDKFPQLWKSKI